MRNIDQVQLFKAGDYGEKGTYTQDDINEIITMFYKLGQDAPIIVNQLDAHDEETPQGENVPAIGWVKKLYTKNDDVLYGDTVFLDEFYSIIKNGMYDYRSVYIPKNEEGHRYLRHVAMLAKQWPAVKGLERIGLKTFDDKKRIRTINIGQSGGQEIRFSQSAESDELSQSGDVIENKRKESKMAELTFTQEEVKLNISEAVNEIKEKLTASFAEKEAKYADQLKAIQAEVEKLKTEGKAFADENAELKAQIKSKIEADEKRNQENIKAFVDNCINIPPPRKESAYKFLVKMSADTSQEGLQALKEAVELYSGQEPPVAFGAFSSAGVSRESGDMFTGSTGKTFEFSMADLVNNVKTKINAPAN